jgi:multiple sugar transport system ATP-binding protein
VVRESGVAARRSGETLSVSPMGEKVHRFDEKGRAV